MTASEFHPDVEIGGDGVKDLELIQSSTNNSPDRVIIAFVRAAIDSKRGYLQDADLPINPSDRALWAAIQHFQTSFGRNPGLDDEGYIDLLLLMARAKAFSQRVDHL